MLRDDGLTRFGHAFAAVGFVLIAGLAVIGLVQQGGQRGWPGPSSKPSRRRLPSCASSCADAPRADRATFAGIAELGAIDVTGDGPVASGARGPRDS